MRAPAVSFVKRFAAALMAALLTFTLLPVSALAEGEGDSPSTEEAQDVNSIQAEEEAGADASEGAEPDTAVSAPLASVLAGAPTAFVNADVALGGEPVVGSFTVDGLTFAVVDDSTVELVGASEAAGVSPRRVVASSQGLSAPLALPDLGSTPAASETKADGSVLALSESIAYNDVEYAVASIGAYAFYLSGVTDVELPASVIDVDDRAFRSSNVASVAVVEGNLAYSSFDGVLYDADQLSLLLIPEGKQGTVLLPKTAESAAPSVFSHCPLVTQIAVEEGSAAFASENGLLYTSDLTTLLRVPVGATEITIHDGCTTIAAGALEACASLSTINAPATVTAISPDVFTSVPTVSLPAAALAEDVPQLTALVALSSADDDLPEVDPADIAVILCEGSDLSFWERNGFSRIMYTKNAPAALLQSSVGNRAQIGTVTVNPNGGSLSWWLSTSGASGTVEYAQGFPLYRNWAILGGTTIHIGSNDTTGYWSVTVQRSGYSFAGWSGYALGNTYSGTNPTTFTATWSANSYTVEYWNKAGTTRLSSDTGFKYDTARSLAAKPSSGVSVGYTAVGWATSKNQSSASYGFGTSQKNLATGGTKQLFLAETANAYTISFSANGGSGSVPSDIAATYDQSYQVTAPALSRTGYSFDGWATSEAGQKAYEKGGPFKNLTSTANGKVTLYAHWSPNTYTVTFDAAGGTAASDISATYDKELTLPASTRQGYAFAGWKDEATGTMYQAGKAKNLTAASNATVKLVAQWDPVIAAEVPLDATAKVDLLGIEEQQQAQAYIRSLCGEPLRVACIELAPLPGGRELFGDDVSQVRLEACAGADAAPVFSLGLGGTTFLSGGESLLALKMEGYGDEVPISYRFDIPDELLPSLVEAAKPVCQVAYTVDLA